MEIRDSNSFLKRLVEIQTCAWAFVVAGIFIHGYLGRTWSEVQVTVVRDGWCGKGQGLGQHCFGDFGMNHQLVNFDSYIEENVPATNTPLSNLIFMVLQKLPYNSALLLYVLLLILAAFIPFITRQGSRPLGFRLQTATLFGLISIGTLGAIDRGNHVLIVVPLLYGYLVSIENGKWNRATALLVAISLIKFWGVILVVALIAKSKYRNAIVVVLSAPLLTAVLLVPFGGSLRFTISAMLRVVTDRELGNRLAPYAFSIHSFFRRVVCAVESKTSCNFEGQANRWVASAYLSVAILFLLLVLVLLIMKKSSQTPHIWMLTLTSVIFLGIPEGPVYQLAVLSAPVAAILATKNFRIERQWMWTTRVLLFAVVVSSVPFTIYSDKPTRLSSVHYVGDPNVFRSDQWLIPFFWLVTFTIATIEMVWKQNSDISREVDQLVQ